MKNCKYSLFLVAAMFMAAFISLSATPQGSAAAGHDKLLKTCRVTSPQGADATVVSTRKSVFLKTDTSLTLVSPDMHQGFIAVKTRVAGRLATVSVSADDTNCLD